MIGERQGTGFVILVDLDVGVIWLKRRTADGKPPWPFVVAAEACLVAQRRRLSLPHIPGSRFYNSQSAGR